MGTKASLPAINYSVAITQSEEDQTGIYRSSDHSTELITCPSSRDQTLAELYLRASRKYSREFFLGSRVRGDDGRLGEYRWLTHEQVLVMVQNLSFKLGTLNAVKENSFGLKCIGILSKSREEWVVTDLACILQGYTVVPIYDVYGEAEILKALVENGITTVA